MTPLLQVEGIHTAYDRVDVLHGVSLTVAPGTITCILGANGAGKSTLIRSILGLTPAHTGSIRFDGAQISGLPTHRVIASGIACIPEGRKVFPKMTVEENLRVGAYQQPDAREVARRIEQAYALFPRLKERRSQLAGTMSGITVLLVEQNARQTLAIAHYGYVLSQGRLVAQGTPQQLNDNEEVRAAYFG